MKRILYLLCGWVCLVITLPLHAQQTVTISGSDLTDAMLFRSVSNAQSANTNYNTYPRITATAWTSGSATYMRTLLRFNLSAIPQGSIIQSATLYLNSDPTKTSSSSAEANSQLSGSNAFYLEKVSASWTNTTVTWNTQPATTTTGRLWTGPSTSVTENLQVNLTSFVQEWVSNPSSNNGLKMILENETHYRARNYASTDHTNTNIRPRLVVTYAAGDDPVKARMDHIFGGLNQSFINTGILTDYGVDAADASLYDGVIRDANITDMHKWRAIYASLLSSTINPSSQLIHLKTINQRLENFWATYDKSNPSVDIPVLFAAYQSLRSDAISSNLISVSNERLLDVANRPQSPYNTFYAFAAAPSLDYDLDGQVSFIFRSSLFVNSSSKTFSSFQVDFGDGAGYQAVSYDVPRNVTYTSAGIKTLRFRLQFTDGSVYNSHSLFNVVAASGMALARFTGSARQDYIFPRASDPTCTEAAFPNPQVWNGVVYGARVTIEYGAPRDATPPGCTPQFRRPFIVVEGYDPSKFSKLGVRDWTYDDFINGVTNGAINIDSDPGTAFLTLSDRLEAAGYDLIFVNLNDGTGDIIGNAFLLENIIRWVNERKVINPATGIRERNVVLGQSMGGMIARYAVCDMEKRRLSNPGANPDHEVRLLVTHDTPHRGANVPLGFQALVNELAPMKLTKIGLASYGSTGAIVGSFLELRDVVPGLDQGKRLLDEPASRQMLVVQDGRTNTFLDGDYRTMVTFTGHTPSFRMVALANGSECGVGQSLLQAGDEILYANANFYASTLLFATGAFTAGATADAASPFFPGLGVITRTALLAFVPFTGKNWKTTYVIRASPSSGTNEAFYGKIGIEKRILFLIPVNITLFEKSRTSVAGSLPWDIAPGGFYSLQDMQGKIPGNPNINAYPILDANLTVRLKGGFNFVPVVSALDITNNPIPSAALSSVFTGGTNATYPSRFATFVTQERNANDVFGSPNNTRHIQFTTRNAFWMFNEMQGVAQPAPICTQFCASTPTSPILSGPDAICTTNTNYNISNVPAGATVNWTWQPPITYVSGQSTSTVVIRGSGSGTAPLVATISNGCGNAPYTKNIRVGGFTTAEIGVTGPTGSCTNSSATFTATMPGGHQSGYSYAWTYPPGWSLQSQNVNNVTLYTGSTGTGGAVRVSINNGCAPSDYSGITAYSYSCSGFTYTVYPNPATSTFTIDVAPEKPSPDVNTSEASAQAAERAVSSGAATVDEYSVELYSDFGKLMYSNTSREKRLTIDTRSFPRGFYIMRITTKNDVISWHVQVQ